MNIQQMKEDMHNKLFGKDHHIFDKTFIKNKEEEMKNKLNVKEEFKLKAENIVYKIKGGIFNFKEKKDKMKEKSNIFSDLKFGEMKTNLNDKIKGVGGWSKMKTLPNAKFNLIGGKMKTGMMNKKFAQLLGSMKVSTNVNEKFTKMMSGMKVGNLDGKLNMMMGKGNINMDLRSKNKAQIVPYGDIGLQTYDSENGAPPKFPKERKIIPKKGFKLFGKTISLQFVGGREKPVQKQEVVTPSISYGDIPISTQVTIGEDEKVKEDKDRREWLKHRLGLTPPTPEEIQQQIVLGQLAKQRADIELTRSQAFAIRKGLAMPKKGKKGTWTTQAVRAIQAVPFTNEWERKKQSLFPSMGIDNTIMKLKLMGGASTTGSGFMQSLSRSGTGLQQALAQPKTYDFDMIRQTMPQQMETPIQQPIQPVQQQRSYNKSPPPGYIVGAGGKIVRYTRGNYQKHT